MVGERATYWILMSSELGPEIALVSEMESRGEPVVSLLESDDLESTDVIHTVKLACGTGSERSASDPDFTHFLYDMSKHVLHLGETVSIR